MGFAERDSIILSGLTDLARDLLFQILPSAEPGENENVHGRLYSTPTDGAEPTFDEEWRELVEPDLGEIFKTAQEIVCGDLENITRDEKSETSELRIPLEHLDGWVNTLNQARLAIAARNNFTEREMEWTPPEDHPHALPLMQMHFYGTLQEHFIRELTK